LQLHDYDKLISKTAWLNDLAINAAFAALQLDCEELDHTKILVLPTYLYAELCRPHGISGASSKYFHLQKNPCKWNVFELDVMFAPANVGTNHWVLVMVHFGSRSVKIYNPLLEGYHYSVEDCLGQFKLFLNFEHYILYRTPLPNNWKFQVAVNAQQQTDGHNCGVFVCRYFEMVLESWLYAKSLPTCSRAFYSPTSYKAQLARRVRFHTDLQLSLAKLRKKKDLMHVFNLLSVKCCPRLALTSPVRSFASDVGRLRLLAEFLS
jgi:Ulp1 family protease